MWVYKKHHEMLQNDILNIWKACESKRSVKIKTYENRKRSKNYPENYPKKLSVMNLYKFVSNQEVLKKVKKACQRVKF